MNALERAQSGFRKCFGEEPSVVARAPGRVNLIGEHVDYSGGLVLPIAIDMDVVVAVRRRADDDINAFAVDVADNDESWRPYVLGVIDLLEIPGGIDMVIAGDVPQGGGLSSSAALEVATATAVSSLFNIAITQRELARLCQQAENIYAGVPCGIMDQFASALCQKSHALMIDCRTLDYQHVPLPADTVLIVADSGVPRTLAGSKYRERFDECARASAALGVELLRDAVDANLDGLPDPLRKRARHVISEIKRVQQFVAAMSAGESESAGELLYASHASLRDDFEVSVPELDTMVQLVRGVVGVYGSRLTGAGFGGCTVTLCSSHAAECVQQALHGYRTWRVTAAQGAAVITP
jgi:galactokinase